MTLSLDAWKGLSMAVFALISVIGAGIAVMMKEKAKQIHVTSGVLFSAGVLLAGGLVHLLVDSNMQFSEIGADGFPWAFSISGLTIICLACLEIILTRVVGDCMGVKQNEGLPGSNGGIALTVEPTETSYSLLGEDGGDGLKPREKRGQEGVAEDAHHLHRMPVASENPFSALLLTIALDLHSIVEGMGVGSAASASQIMSVFVAVAVHKGFTAFSLAQGMVSSGYWQDRDKRKYFYYSVGTFISVNVLGIAIGWGLSRGGEATALTATLAGITSGSFIYVALMEIVPQETKTIHRERLSLLPVLLSFLLGFCLMALLAIWI